MKFTVKDGLSICAELELHAWACIKDVKDQLTAQLHIPQPRQRLFYQGRELKNTHTLNDCQITDGATIYLAPSFSASSSSSSVEFDLISVYGDVHCSPEMAETINQCRQGLASGLAPRLAMEGTGGTYFLRSQTKARVAVFKAEDEEPFAPSNPRGYQGVMGGAGFRQGLVSGEGAIREVAAYLVDHGGFSGVPSTTRVEMSKRAFTQSSTTGNVKRLSNGVSLFANPSVFTASISSENLAALARGTSSTTIHSSPSSSDLFDTSPRPLHPSPSMEFTAKTKIGSLQTYVEYDELAGDVAPQLFPSAEVHKIAILDIRLFNIDRNEANILVQRRYPQTERKGGVAGEGRLNAMFSPPLGPSHLHHQGHTGFSPEQPFSFSPLTSPVNSGRFFDSPTLGSATPQYGALTPTMNAIPSSPDLPSSMQLPPAASSLSASFNLNYPMRAHSFETGNGSSIIRPPPSIPIPIPAASNLPSLSLHSDPHLSSSVPAPSRLQARLAALKTMRAQAAAEKPTYHLIPIDHSYTLPDTLELASVDWCWMDWPQAKMPLAPAMKEYVLKLDVKADIEMLRTKLAIREECLKVMRISGMLLQKGVAADLTLYDIASLICRKDIDKPSQLEVLCAQATTMARGVKSNVARRATIKSTPTSPAAVTESDSSSDSQDSPPQSADFSSPTVGGFSSPSIGPSSSLTCMLQQNRHGKKEEDEHKEDDEDPILAPPPCISRSSLNSHIPDLTLPSALHATAPRPIPGPSLSRSNSLDLILHRSISYDDFRAVKVAKAGFHMSSITTQALSEEEDSDEDDRDRGEKRISSPPSSHPPRGGDKVSGSGVYQVDGVYHHAGHEKKSVWTSEEQSQLFFSCLSGLMDSAIERLKSNKVKGERQLIK